MMKPFQLTKRIEKGFDLIHGCKEKYPRPYFDCDCLPISRRRYTVLKFQEETEETTAQLSRTYWAFVAEELQGGLAHART